MIVYSQSSHGAWTYLLEDCSNMQKSGREVGTTAAFASYSVICEHSWWYLNTQPECRLLKITELM